MAKGTSKSQRSTIIITVLVNVAIFTSILLFTPGLPPNIRFESYKLSPAQKLEGKLAPNNILDKAELMYDGEFIGPESIAIRGNEIFTGVNGGKVLKIKDGEITTIAQFGDNCDEDEFWDEESCGRPLGMRFDSNGKLIVADAYYGLFRLDVDTGKYEILVDSSVPIDGKRPLIPDDLDISQNGDIYWSDGSTTSSLYNSIIEYFGGPTGRLLKYDPIQNTSIVLINGLHFANGVQLSKNENYVMVSESMRARVWRYYLKGDKKGTRDILIDGLPGLPDNIRTNGRGGYYISLAVAREKNFPTPGELLGSLPLIRKLILRIHGLIHSSFDLADDYTTNLFIKAIKYYVGRLGPLSDPNNFSKKVIIVEIDEDGNIIGSLQTQNGPIKFVTEVCVTDKYTYFGSFSEPRLWRISTKDIQNSIIQ